MGVVGVEFATTAQLTMKRDDKYEKVDENPAQSPRVAMEDSERLMSALEGSRRRRKKAFVLIIVAALAVLASLLLALVVGASIGVRVTRAREANRLPSDPYKKAVALLADFPLIDGYVNFANQPLPHIIIY